MRRYSNIYFILQSFKHITSNQVMIYEKVKIFIEIVYVHFVFYIPIIIDIKQKSKF